MDSEFETKKVPDSEKQSSPISQPILDPETKARISPESSLGGAFKKFYRENKIYFWAIISGLIILSVLAFFALRPNRVAPKEANLELSVVAPETAPTNGEVVYQIKMANHDAATLVSLELEIIYPDGVSFVSSAPVNAENSSGTLYKLPDLVSGQNTAIFIKTKVSGNINDEKKLIANLHYRFTNFNSDFIKTAENSLRLLAADVILELNGPTSTDNAQLVSYDVHYKNSSDHDLDNVRIELTYPPAFSFASGTPQPDSGKNIWNVGRLSKGGEGRLSFQGSFQSAEPGSSQSISAALEVLDASGNYYKQAETSFSTNITNSPLVVNQSLVNNQDNVAFPGDTLTVELKYQNNTTVAAKAVNIVVTLTGSSLDLSTISAEGGQISSNTITWNASSTQNLENLNPNDGGTLRYSVKVKNPATKDTSKNLTITLASKIKSNEYQSFLPGSSLNLKIASTASLQEGVEYVSGSLPPKVGKSTTYRVTLSLRNSTNDLAQGLLTAFIPLDPGSFDSSSISPTKESSLLKFDPSSGKLTWQVGNVPAHTGDFSPLRQVSFTVRVIPSSSQVGHTVTLLKTISFVANDTFANQAVKLEADDLTTGDVSGGFANGRVVQ